MQLRHIFPKSSSSSYNLGDDQIAMISTERRVNKVFFLLRALATLFYFPVWCNGEFKVLNIGYPMDMHSTNNSLNL